MSDDNIEDLIKIAKTPTKKKIKPTEAYSDARKFVLEFKISSGKHEIQASMLYKMYKMWKGKKAVTSTRFFIDFKPYFDRIQRVKGTFYLLNMSALDLEQLVLDAINEKKEN